MSVDALLSRLEGVRKTGADRWVARCPSHGDKHASLSIRELIDGRVLAHCFAQCDIEEVITAAGLEMTVLFPDRPLSPDTKLERRPFNPSDILACVAFETAIALDCANQLRAGNALSVEDHARLVMACGRLVAALDIANGPITSRRKTGAQ